MSYNNIQQTSLEQDFNSQLEKLDEQRAKRMQNQVEITLETIAAKVKDCQTEILRIKSEQKSWKTFLLNFLSGEIVRLFDGRLTVPNYSPRDKAEQDVFLFVGTHWVQLPRPCYFGTIVKLARSMGLPDADGCQPAFMNLLFEQVAFRVSCFRNEIVPNDEAWLNVENGTLEIKGNGSIVFREHRRDDFFQYVLPYHYDAREQCPKWRRFLDQMLPDADTQKVLAEYVGYCFTRGIKAEKMLVLHGSGSNGKSVVLDVIEALMGTANVSNVGLSELTEKEEKCAMLENKLVNISHESGRELSTAKLKQLVSNEPVVVRRLYQNSHSMTCYAKLITSFNVLPKAEQTHGFFRRFIIVPFEQTVTESEMDVDLAKKLCGELPGILNWVLEALREFVVRRAFTQSQVCKDASLHYRHLSDSVLLFIEEKCEVTEQCEKPGKDLYPAYKNYCMESGLRYLGKNIFFEQLKSHGILQAEKHHVLFFNLKLTEENEW